MNNKIERLLLSLLLGISILLGLSFWLHTFFGFNIFFKDHWNELSRLQALQIPVARGFYVSIYFSIFLFIFGLYLIYMPSIKRIYIKTFNKEPKITTNSQPSAAPEKKEEQPEPEPTNNFSLSRPPRLNLPKNMEKRAAARHEELKKAPATAKTSTATQQNNTESVSPYNSVLANIFTDNGFTVKQPSLVAGFTPNLFAIGPNEVIWFGGVDANIGELNKAYEELKSITKTTLDDIEIYINPFIIDTLGQYQADDSVMIFKSIDELKEFIQNNPAAELTDENKENFVAYSEYIDTILQYVKNV